MCVFVYEYMCVQARACEFIYGLCKQRRSLRWCYDGLFKKPEPFSEPGEQRTQNCQPHQSSVNGDINMFLFQLCSSVNGDINIFVPVILYCTVDGDIHMFLF